MKAPANHIPRPDDGEPAARVLPALPQLRVSAPPPACNDPGVPARGCEGQPTVLLVCTGLDDAGLHLDVVLRAQGTEQILASRIGERDAIAEARRIAMLYGARLAMLSLAGHLVQLEPAQQPSPRRGGSPLSGRRPRFLCRRKTGLPVTGRALSGAEKSRETVQPGAGDEAGEQDEAGIAV